MKTLRVWIVSLMVLSLFAACGGKTAQEQDNPVRNSNGKADAPGSCLGDDGTKYCDNYYPERTCQCDELCETFGDCCADKAEVCNKPKICGPFLGGNCDTGEVCDLHTCTVGGQGECKPVPQMCTYLYKPVCGCDGKTYPNDCERLKAGIALDHEGACVGQFCGGIAGIQCPAGQKCQLDGNYPDAGGKCVPLECKDYDKKWKCLIHGCEWVVCPFDTCDRPYICRKKCQPVVCEMYCPFGFDTDENGCEICKCAPAQKCGGIAGLTCPDGFWCKLDGNYPDAMGECLLLPPICGGIAGFPCPQGFKCKLDGNYPDAAGKCVPEDYCDVPADCVGLIHPMCVGAWTCQNHKCQYQCGYVPPQPRNPVSGPCIRNSKDICASDMDCKAGGCGGELCYNPAVSSGISTCDCFPPTGVSCGCVQGKCTWWN